MGISDRIESFIIELLKNDDSPVEIGRNELASIFNCVPSQINYVISTRFSPEKGYIVESRRGGGGFLRIQRIEIHDEISHVISKIGNELNYSDMRDFTEFLYSSGKLEYEVAKAMLRGLSDKVLSSAGEFKNRVRADIFKNMIVNGK